MTTSPAPSYHEESQKQKLWSKVKENPMVPLGTLGMFGMAGYGIYNFKNRGNQTASMYVMKYRVRAQSMVVGAMAISVGYALLRDYVWDKEGYQQRMNENESS